MDELSIVSNFTKGIVSKLLQKIIKKKLDCEIKLDLNDLQVTIVEGKTRIHLDVTADLSKEELLKLLKKAGI